MHSASAFGFWVLLPENSAYFCYTVSVESTIQSNLRYGTKSMTVIYFRHMYKKGKAERLNNNGIKISYY